MSCADKTFAEAMQEMKEMVKNPGAYHDIVDQKRVAFPIFVETSEIVRTFLKENPEQLKNMTNLLRKIDRISFDMAKEDADKIEEMNQKLKKMLGVK